MGAEWSHLTDVGPAPRAHHGMVASIDGSAIVVYGGLDNSQLFDDRWAWNGFAWVDEGPAFDRLDPGPRSHHGLARGPDGLVLFGGATNSSTFESLVNDTWIENESTGWGLAANGGPRPSPRAYRHSVTTRGETPSSSTVVSTAADFYGSVAMTWTPPVANCTQSCVLPPLSLANNRA